MKQPRRWDRVRDVLTTFLLVALIVITVGLQIQVSSRNRDIKTVGMVIRTVGAATDDLKTIVGTANASTTRTECIRAASAALEAARWHSIAELVGASTREQARASAEKLKNLPNLIDLAANGGVLNGERVERCPPIATTTPTTLPRR